MRFYELGSKMKIHLKDLRLRINGGIDFPTCRSNEKLLDFSYYLMTTDKGEVTCKRCLRKVKKRVEYYNGQKKSFFIFSYIYFKFN